MEVLKGFICITNPNWNNTLSKNNISTGCIWLRKNVFKVISKGEPIFFVEKKTRVLRGYGVFERFEINTAKSCWEKYGSSSGAQNFNNFLSQINFSNNEEGWSKDIGNIIVKDIIWTTNEISIHDTGVNFPKPIVTGKTINSEEIKTLLTFFDFV